MDGRRCRKTAAASVHFKGAAPERAARSRIARKKTVPIYEYQCGKCSAVTEKIQGMNDAPLKKCPSCGGKLEKKMSAGAFVLKGQGFYANDYPHKGDGQGNGKGAKKPASCPASEGEAPPACAGCPKAG